MTIRLTTLIAVLCALLGGAAMALAYALDRPEPGVVRAPTCENVEYVHQLGCAWTGPARLRLEGGPALEFTASHKIAGGIEGWEIFEPEDDGRVLTVTIYNTRPVRAVTAEGEVRGAEVEAPPPWPRLLQIVTAVLLALALVLALIDERVRAALSARPREPTPRRVWALLAATFALASFALLSMFNVGYDEQCNPAAPLWQNVALILAGLAVLTGVMGGVGALMSAAQHRTVAAVMSVPAALVCLYATYYVAAISLLGCSTS